MEMRIDAFLSKHGFASRRNAKDMIELRRVKLNGLDVEEIVRVDPDKDVVEIDGKVFDPKNHSLRYILFNKPLNVLSTTSDDRGRKTVLDYIKVSEKVYPVGRLDYNSTGLMLLTNDGDLALKLTHPRYQVPKTYEVDVDKRPNEDQLRELAAGVEIYETKTSPAQVKVLGERRLEIVIKQGMKRQIREMCKAVNLRVVSLTRTRIGSLGLDGLGLGEFRDLTKEEIDKLRII
ncbi:MAG: pseudouridine synthase [Patescibacteria group bacterium]|jgi:pseudouridine synthase